MGCQFILNKLYHKMINCAIKRTMSEASTWSLIKCTTYLKFRRFNTLKDTVISVYGGSSYEDFNFPKRILGWLE